MSTSRARLAPAIALTFVLVSALLPAAAPASPSGVVISELRFRGPAGASDEFVELLNASSSAVDVSGWKLQGCSASSSSATTRATIPDGTTLAAGQHYLFAGPAYSGSVAGDQSYSIGFADTGGARVTTADGTVVDGAGSSALASGLCREGAGLELPTTDADASFERLDGGHRDTDDNAADFTVRSPSDPQGRGPGTDLPSVSIADASAPEGNSGSADALFTVELSAASTARISIDFATADGSAVAPGDYSAASGTLVFEPGESQKTIAVPIAGDMLPEGNETFSVTLAAGDGYTIADGSASGTIVDDDAPPPAGMLRIRGAGFLAEPADAAFALKVAEGSRGLKGLVLYADPAAGVALFARSVSDATVEGGRATIRGTGIVAGQTVAFTIVADDGGRDDSLSVSWPGYSASAAVVDGSVVVRSR